MLRPTLALIGVVWASGLLPVPGVVWASGLPPVPQGRPEAHTTPASLVTHIQQQPEDIPTIFRGYGERLMSGDASLEQFLNAFTREHAKRERDVRVLVSLQLVDPNRFLGEADFRARVMRILPRALDTTVPLDVRLACLRELNELGLTFDEAESVALGWSVVPRSSASRRIAFGDDVRMPDDLSGPIETSIFSLTSQFFTVDEAQTFVDAVRKKRKVVVITDLPLKNVIRIDPLSRPYTPWPRDPFIIGRDKRGIVFVNRPNLQPDREEDANMVRALVQSAPFEARWAVAPVPFHNGHVLLTPDAAWISIHTVEIRALEILGLTRVPVESFSSPAGIEAYLVAVRKAAKELESLYRRPVKFVHPLDPDPALFQALGGGGGFDLDSLVTMLPQRDGSLAAIVGEIGPRYAVPRAYGAGEVLPATGLAAFLDLIARSLTSQHVKVFRLPLMLVDAQPKPFLLGWNNVVLEPGHAEGFATLIPEGDKLAKETFAKAGYELTLYPPLINSVKLSGGYRCASNHVRR